MSLLPAVTRMRGGLRPSPGEYATPRREGAPPVTEYSQMSLPDSVSRATTRLAGAGQIVPMKRPIAIDHPADAHTFYILNVSRDCAIEKLLAPINTGSW